MTESAWETRTWFSAVVESSIDAVLSKTLDGTITSWNPSAERLYGYTAQEMIGQSAELLIPLSQRAEMAAWMMRVARGESVAKHRAERVAKDGRSVWVSLSLSPVRNNHGEVIGAASIAHDITAQVIAERAVDASEERYRALVDASPDAIVLMDLEGVILTANIQAEELFGAESALALEGQNALAMFAGTHLEVVELAREAFERDGAINGMRSTLTLADGSVRHIEINCGMLRGRDGRPLGMVGITRDITAQMLAETDLRASEERLQLAVQAAQMETWDWDVRTGGGWSRGLPGLLGHSPKASMRSREEFFRHVHPGDRIAVECWLEDIRSADADENVRAVAMDFRVITPDDGVRWVQTHAQELVSDDGLLPRLVGVAQDITELKVIEAQREANVQAEKLRALGQMASGVAHDLNQSLAIVAGYADIARQELTSLAVYPGTLAQALDLIARAGLDGGETVRRLLTFGKPQPEGKAAPVDVARLLRDVATLTAPKWRDAAQVEGRPISLVVDTGGTSTFVQGWESSLREALTNLVFNSVDALPRGGNIFLRAHRVGTDVAITVSDSGGGMPAEVRERVFEPYFTTKGERGTGLGLPQVYGIVQQHHGHIEVESAPGQGTTFSITLPIAVGPEPSVSIAVQEGFTTGLRVIVVDDEANLVRMTSTMLKGTGHSVRSALSGEEALGLLEAEPADVVVSDLGLGDGMTGWDLAEAVRSRWPGTRFVLATGWGAAFSVEEAAARGVDCLLPKPYVSETLRRAVSPGPAVVTHA